ncbi:MAG: hypothetical protein HYW37_00610 [Candidatus Colwellbacteria bacterium]|nr:hypothetical protein [Candidatus Colwellbacteria bacterium]
MPLVQLRKNSRRVGGADIDRLREELPKIVADSLDGGQEQSHLVPDDIEIQVSDGDPRDVNVHYDVGVVILANDYPERAVNLQDRTDGIKGRVEHLLPLGVKFSVWVLLAQGGWATGEGLESRQGNAGDHSQSADPPGV